MVNERLTPAPEFLMAPAIWKPRGPPLSRSSMRDRLCRSLDKPPLRCVAASLAKGEQEVPIQVERTGLAQGLVLFLRGDVMEPQHLQLAGQPRALLVRIGELLHGSQRVHVPRERAGKRDLLDALPDLRCGGGHLGSNGGHDL